VIKKWSKSQNNNVHNILNPRATQTTAVIYNYNNGVVVGYSVFRAEKYILYLKFTGLFALW
jgi:hypothetical protein